MSKGRQKVEMVKMKNEKNLQVTFSKRRVSLFKKACEICTLTGSEVAIIVFSPGDKAYSFGSPGVSEIIKRFEGQTSHLISHPCAIKEVHHGTNIPSFNIEVGELEDHLDNAKKKGNDIEEMVKSCSNRHWWEAPINELNILQLEQLKYTYEDLCKKVQSRVKPATPTMNAVLGFENFDY